MRKDDSNGHGARSTGDVTGADVMGFGAFANPGLEAAFRASNVWLKGMGSLNEEMLSFSQEQLGKYMEASQSLMRCASMEQAITTQCDIARTTLESCYREASKLLSLTSDIARQTLKVEGIGAGE